MLYNMGVTASMRCTFLRSPRDSMVRRITLRLSAKNTCKADCCDHLERRHSRQMPLAPVIFRAHCQAKVAQQTMLARSVCELKGGRRSNFAGSPVFAVWQRYAYGGALVSVIRCDRHGAALSSRCEV